jgi:hypothetical protein
MARPPCLLYQHVCQLNPSNKYGKYAIMRYTIITVLQPMLTCAYERSGISRLYSIDVSGPDTNEAILSAKTDVG